MFELPAALRGQGGKIEERDSRMAGWLGALKEDIFRGTLNRYNKRTLPDDHGQGETETFPDG